jgi:hypothetical protein
MLKVRTQKKKMKKNSATEDERRDGVRRGLYLKMLVAGFPPRRPGFAPVSGQVAFVVDKVALGQVFSEYFGFPCQNHSFHQLLHPHNHPRQVQ